MERLEPEQKFIDARGIDNPAIKSQDILASARGSGCLLFLTTLTAYKGLGGNKKIPPRSFPIIGIVRLVSHGRLCWVY
jgi:hypothetical protein